MDLHNSGLTLQLLHTLEAVLRNGSVSRAAAEMGHTQPAVSVSLRRLRQILDDPLLVRSGSHLVPTERASTLRTRLPGLLSELTELLSTHTDFVALQSQREFAIATADCMQAFFLPRLVSAVEQHAPGVSLRLRALGADFDFGKALEERRLDVVIGNWPDPPPYLRRRVLFEDRMVCLVRPGHPLVTGCSMDLQTYLKLDHVAPEPYMTTALGPVDGALALLGVQRKIKVTVPDFSLAGYVVADSDLVFTSSSHFGSYYADLLGLSVIDAPRELPPMRFYMLWHECSHMDSAGTWLRNQIAGVARESQPPLE
jgi:DNA-binding transcriptional LysR family regulator